MNAHQGLVSYTVGHDGYDVLENVLFDASTKNPRRSISRWEAGKYVTEMFRDLTMREIVAGEVICVHMFNHILYPLSVSVLGYAWRRLSVPHPRAIDPAKKDEVEREIEVYLL